jgi:hypothetical protein
MAGTFRFAAQNGHQSLKYKNLVQPLQAKLLVGLKPNFTGVINSIPSCANYGTFCFAAQNGHQS